MTPPTPVFAPPNGSIADGWLWVSAFTAIVTPGTYETMPALPTNELRTNGASIAFVHRRSCCISGTTSAPASPPSTSMRARNVLCAQCSLHVWASVSSSTSVGSRPTPRKCSTIACSSARSSDRPRSRLSACSAPSSRSRMATWSTDCSAVASVSTNDGSSGASAQRSITWLASSRRASWASVSGRSSPCTSKCLPVATSTWAMPPTVAIASVTAAATGSVTPGSNSVSMPPFGAVQLDRCSSGSTSTACIAFLSSAVSLVAKNTTSATSMPVTSARPSACASASRPAARGSAPLVRMVRRAPDATASNLRPGHRPPASSRTKSKSVGLPAVPAVRPGPRRAGEATRTGSVERRDATRAGTTW